KLTALFFIAIFIAKNVGYLQQSVLSGCPNCANTHSSFRCVVQHEKIKQELRPCQCCYVASRLRWFISVFAVGSSLRRSLFLSGPVRKDGHQSTAGEIEKRASWLDRRDALIISDFHPLHLCFVAVNYSFRLRS